MEDPQLLRYSRHIMLPRIDIEGQQKLLDASVLVIGLGGLGSPAAMYLAASGIGHLVINDFDTVDLSNLQRQIIHGTPDLGRTKTRSASERLQQINPDIRITVMEGRLGPEELDRAMSQVDVILDCSDNLGTRFAINRACLRQQKPLVSGAAIRMEGQLAVFRPGVGDSPCYSCLYEGAEELPDSCARNGVIAPLPGIVGSMQALEAIKLLAVNDYDPTGRVYFFDAFSMDWRCLTLRRNPACSTCGG